MFNKKGKLLWRFTGEPGQPLDHPSLAEPLPNGDVLVTDDYNHRVIVVDPTTDKIVWQYGHYGQSGSAPGLPGQPRRARSGSAVLDDRPDLRSATESPVGMRAARARLELL